MPFLHFFDGFRTSHEVNKIEQLTDEDMRAMIDEEPSRPPRPRLSPDHPVLRGTAQNPMCTSRAARRSTLLRRLPGNRPGSDGQVRQPHRPLLPPV
jgi:pyruvate/2-oxoacid:ferredoxin oxidoreductase alpha subunit